MRLKEREKAHTTTDITGFTLVTTCRNVMGVYLGAALQQGLCLNFSNK